MKKKLDLERIGELKIIFKKIHKESSFHYSSSGGVYYYEISQTDNYRGEYDKVFMEEIKPILLSIRKEFDKDKHLSDQDSYLWGVVSGFIIFTGLSIFIWYKKILDEYWYYGSGIFGIMALIGLILIPFAYKWLKEAEEKTKKLKKQEKELRDSI